MAGEIVHQIHLTAGMQNAYAYEWRQSANKLAQDVREFLGEDAQLAKRYHSLLGGKWNHIMVLVIENVNPSNTDTFHRIKPILDIIGGNNR